VDFDEPFTKLFNQGMLCKKPDDVEKYGTKAMKMSKSMGNVVSPDDLVRDYGCDSLRMYELFVGPPELDAEWDDRGIDGVHRFLSRFYTLVSENADKDFAETDDMVKLRHKLVYDITNRLETFSLNTVISGFMEYNNKLIDLTKKQGGIDKTTLNTLVTLIAPFAPHIAEELWEQLGHTTSIFEGNKWPEYDEDAMKDDEIEMAVQVNGKVKAKVVLAADEAKDSALEKAKAALGDKLPANIVKEIYVPRKIINIVGK
jgi:leucyl-tRNA synthetase